MPESIEPTTPVTPQLDDVDIERDGAWVALAPDTYARIGNGHTLADAAAAARARGVAHPVFLKLAPLDGLFIPGAAV